MAGRYLPGLYFRNQRVDAAYRKELVYGEDDPMRTQPPTLGALFTRVRRNYFRRLLLDRPGQYRRADQPKKRILSANEREIRRRLPKE